MLSDEARIALLALGLPVAFDEPLACHCSFGVGGPADVYASSPDGEQTTALLAWARAHKVAVTRWAGTENQIVADAGIKGLVIGPAEVEGGEGRRLFAEPARGESVDAMVRRAGMRGVRVRGARIDPEDGNRVLNEGDATTQDVLLLMDSVRRRIARDWGIQLVDELVVIGRRGR